MGAVVSCTQPAADADLFIAEPVLLNTYDLGTGGGGRVLNDLLQPLGTGAFHCGVEVYGREWTYCSDGVFSCRPKRFPGHTFHESVSVGTTRQDRKGTWTIVARLEKEWSQESYHVLRHNCCHFSARLVERLGAGSVPAFVLSLAHAGALCEKECCMEESVCCVSVKRRCTGKAQAVAPEVIGVDEEAPPPSERAISGRSLRCRAAQRQAPPQKEPSGAEPTPGCLSQPHCGRRRRLAGSAPCRPEESKQESDPEADASRVTDGGPPSPR